MSSGGADVEQLMGRAQAGDADALGELLQLYRNYLALLARLNIDARLQGKVDASDLVQETFLKAHRNFGQFRGNTEEELVSWLRQILTNNLANLVRHFLGLKRRDVRLERQLAAEMDRSSRLMDGGLIAPGSSPSRQASRREQAVLLADVLKQLPADYREVLILRHLEGLTFAQVAQRLGRTDDSVQKLWVRALARLRRSLGEAP